MVKRKGLGDKSPKQKARMTRRLRFFRYGPRFQQRLDLGGKRENLAVVVVIERLNAERVAREEQSAFSVIPDRERVHAAQVPHHVLPIFRVEVKQYLGVARRFENVPLLS